jgi:hypothetical protein
MTTSRLLLPMGRGRASGWESREEPLYEGLVTVDLRSPKGTSWAYDITHLKDAIQRFLDAWNAKCHPFAWVKTADHILATAKPKAISGPKH